MADEQKTEDAKRISISKIYVKDFSFESPKAPGVFRSTEWKPQTDLNLRSSHTAIEGEDGLHDFLIDGYEEEEFSAIVGSFCPNILFPYAREAVATVVQKGGFPEFVLQPINFDSLYMQSRQKVAEKEAEGEEKH